MATPNTAASNERANDFAVDYAAGTLEILEGATVLASHTLAGFAAAASGSITADAIADATNAATGTADSAELSVGTEVYTLSVGVTDSGAELELDTLDFIAGGNSQINSFVVSF
jgi:hypothetical protein